MLSLSMMGSFTGTQSRKASNKKKHGQFYCVGILNVYENIRFN